MAPDLVRRKRSENPSQGSQRQVVEIYGKLQTASVYHYTDNSVSMLIGDGKTPSPQITQINLTFTINFNFFLH